MKPSAGIHMIGDGATSGETYGGKAAGLETLAQAGLAIPPTLCFPCGISVDELETWAQLAQGLEELEMATELDNARSRTPLGAWPGSRANMVLKSCVLIFYLPGS